MGAHPKKKLTKSRIGKRRNSKFKKAKIPSLSTCPHCGKKKLPHRSCPECKKYK